MKTVRNVLFACLIVLVAFAAKLRAGEIWDGPYCDDPGKNQVNFTATDGGCQDDESECADACKLCYDLFPKAVNIDECVPGAAFHYVACTCYFVQPDADNHNRSSR